MTPNYYRQALALMSKRLREDGFEASAVTVEQSIPMLDERDVGDDGL